MLITLVAFLLILGLLVFVHELGHFLVAKKMGMQVDEFAIGFPPRIFARTVGETTYCINAIPFGGYVKIHGEHPGEEPLNERAFGQKSVLARIAVMVAGVGMNLLLAFVTLTIAFSVGYTSIGQQLANTPGATVTKAQVYVGEVMPGSAAATVGLQPGDMIQSIQGAVEMPTGYLTVAKVQAYTKQLQETGKRDARLTYQHNQASHTVPVTVAASGPALGVAIQDVDAVRLPIYRAPIAALKEMKLILGLTWDSLKGFAARLVVHGQLDPNVTGPVGIYQATASATQQGTQAVIFLVVALSLNLALLNILPIPALDGGKLFFLILEGVAGRRVVSEYTEHLAGAIGFFVLIGLIAILSVRDLMRL